MKRPRLRNCEDRYGHAAACQCLPPARQDVVNEVNRINQYANDAVRTSPNIGRVDERVSANRATPRR